MALLDIFTNPSSFFLQTSGLLALWSLLYLLILYLIRPKPKEITMPSLMFLFRDAGKSKFRNFLRTLMRNLLFLIQLILLLALCIALAKPYVNVSSEVALDTTVLVIDASASSQTKVDGMTRFENSIEIARSMLGQRNTIILIKSVPEVVAEDLDPDDAANLLDSLRPADTGSAVYDSIMLAMSYIEGNGRVVIISDMIETETESDYAAAIRTLEAKGINVVARSVFSEARNAGIVDLDISEDETKVAVKNFDESSRSVTVTIGPASETVEIPANSLEILSFDTPHGKSTVLLSSERDDFPLDDVAYISTPEKRKIPALLITNDENIFLTTALGLLEDIELEVQNPPRVDIDHPIIIMSNIDKGLVLPGTFKDAERAVRNGAALIITGQEDIFQLPWRGLLPVDYLGMGESGLVTKPREYSFTEDLEFGSTSYYHKTQLADDSISVIAEIEGSPMITHEPYREGDIFYYGLIDSASEFPRDPQYPLFWKHVIAFLTGKDDLDSLNYDTGRIMTFESQLEVKTPLDTEKTQILTLENAGFYELPDRTVSSNLLDVRESDVGLQVEETRLRATRAQGTKADIPIEYTHIALIAALLLIFIELIYIKFRGDI